jgi:hypothetical protein
MAFDLSTAKPESSGFDLSSAQPEAETAEAVDEPQEQGVGSMLLGGANILASGVAGAGEQVIEGLSELGGVITGRGPEQSIQSAQALTEAIPGIPLGEDAQQLIQNISERFNASPQVAQDIFNFVTHNISALPETVGDIGQKIGEPIGLGSTLGAGFSAIPAGLEAVTALKGARVLQAVPDALDAAGGSKAISLVDPQTGVPTPQFEKALKSKGMTIDNVGTELITLPKNLEPKQAVNAIVKRKLLSGARDDALAKFKISKVGGIEDDLIAKEALRQGFQAGDIQAAKTASTETKRGMLEMIKMTRDIKANTSLAKKFRPTDIVGKSVMRRFSHVRDSADIARKELDTIAKTKLKGVKINSDSVRANFLDELDKMDIEVDTSTLRPKLNFVGSMISKDPTSQKVVNDVMDLLAEDRAPDALRAHKLKRQLDTMIDFNKKSAAGLTDAGRDIAKSVRRSLNNVIRDVSDEYGAVNDVLSESIDSLDEFQRVLGPSIDVFAEGAAKSVGQDLRGLLSNRKSRVRLQNAVNSLDDTAKNLGGNFDDDINDLVNFAEILDDQFGAVAKTSFKGQIGSAVKQASRGKAGAFEAGVEKVATVIEKRRGINDRAALRSIEALLKRKK